MLGRTSSLSGGNGLNRCRFRAGALVAAILLCAALFVNVGCKKQEQKAQKEKVVNVRVWTAETRPLRPFVESVGTLNPYEMVNVSSELDGILQSIRVNEGSSVSRGQLIAEMKVTNSSR